MSFGVSISDFIAVGKLIRNTVNALRNSEPEYQELIRELENLQKVLHHVDKLEARGNQALIVNDLKCTALTCRFILEEFLNRLQKYEKSLGPWRSDNKAKVAWKKSLWAFGMRDEANKLRGYLNLHIGTVNALLNAHNFQNYGVAMERMDKDHGNLMMSIEGSSAQSERIQSAIDSQATVVQETKSTLQSLFQVVNNDIVSPIKILTNLMNKACVSTQQIYTIVLELRAVLSGPDARFIYAQAPVKVEDVLGRVFPFASECSVAALDTEIRARFRYGLGHKEVQAGKFEIFNALNSQQLLTPASDAGFLPGMSIVMAIILEDKYNGNNECPVPHCQSRNVEAAKGGGQVCCVCKVWFDGPSRKRKRPLVPIEGAAIRPEAKQSALTTSESIFEANEREEKNIEKASIKRMRFDPPRHSDYPIDRQAGGSNSGAARDAKLSKPPAGRWDTHPLVAYERSLRKNYECPVCGSPFHQEPKLWEHSNFHHAEYLANEGLAKKFRAIALEKSRSRIMAAQRSQKLW